MTTREYFQTVLDAHISHEMDVESAELIRRLDDRNNKRKSADSKEKREVRSRVDAVKAFFLDHKGESFTRDQIAEHCGISAGQATAACKALGDFITKGEAKVDKTKRMVYSLAE